jgi:hypothetical protein
MNKTAGTILAIFVAAIGMVTFLVATTIGQDIGTEFGHGSYGEIESAMDDAGLDVQLGSTTSDADIVGGYEKTAYDVFSPEGDGLVVVRAFSGPKQLAEIGEDSYVGDAGVGYRWEQFLVTITTGSDPAAIELLDHAMSELGAVEVFNQL